MKKLFSEALKEYSAFKESQTGNSKISVAEVKELREEFKRVRKETSKENSYKDASSKRNFAKVVKNFADFKESKTGSRSITSAEIAMLREGLKEKGPKEVSFEKVNHRISEAKVQKKTENKSDFDKLVEQYTNYKLQKTGTKVLTIQERMKLRNEFNRIEEAKKAEKDPTKSEPKTLKEAIIAYSEYKKANNGNGKVTREEFEAIRQEFKESKAAANQAAENKPVENKAASAPNGNDIVKSLKEAADCVRMGRRALKEGDIPLAQDMATQAGNAVDAATGAAPDASAIDPTLAQKITDVKVAVDDLATAAGVSAPVDLGANVAANIPPVEGQPVDATTAAPAPVQENKIDVNAVMSRINERKAAIDNKDNPYNVKDITAGDPTGIDKMEFATAGNETNQSQLAKIPSAQALAKGSDKNVVRFGKDETYTPPKGVQAVGSAKKESKSLDEQDVDRYLEKLDFKKIFSQSNGVIDAPEC